MGVVDDLLSELAYALPSGHSFGYSTADAANDVYEGWAWLVVVETALGLGWTGGLINCGTGRPILLFRRGPGVISSSTPYTYALLATPFRRAGPDRAIEVHLGIKVAGRSGVAHEFDVIALTRLGADRARARGKNPRHVEVVLHLECKLLSGPLQLPLARQMIGLTVDCKLGRRGGLMSHFGAPLGFRHLLSHYRLAYTADAFPGALGEAELRSQVARVLGAYGRR